MGQLITLLDNVDTDVSESEWLRHGWVVSLAESNRTLDNGDPAPYRDFTRVSFEFYPELSNTTNGCSIVGHRLITEWMKKPIHEV